MNYNIKRNLKGLEEFKRRREKVIVPAYLLSYDRDRDAEKVYALSLLIRFNKHEISYDEAIIKLKNYIK